MKTKLTDLNVPSADKQLIRDVLKTRNPAALTAFVKASINRRDQLRGKEPAEFTFNFEKVAESKSRSRARKICDRVLRLEDRKSVSVLCALVITHRKNCRAKASA